MCTSAFYAFTAGVSTFSFIYKSNQAAAGLFTAEKFANYGTTGLWTAVLSEYLKGLSQEMNWTFFVDIIRKMDQGRGLFLTNVFL
jgi:hypothetical protein